MKNRIDDYLNKENVCRRLGERHFDPYRSPSILPPEPNETLYDKGVLVAAICMSLFMGFFFGLASGCFILAIM